VNDRHHFANGRELALERLRRDLAEHDRSGRRETPFSAAIREQLAQEQSLEELSSGSAA
jgi:hypothetical protein